MKMAPMKPDVDTAITTENFAAFGRFAPSSLDTLTLEKEAAAKNEILQFSENCTRSVTFLV
jgi:hypothetical protein